MRECTVSETPQQMGCGSRGCSITCSMEMFSMLKHSLSSDNINPITKYFEVTKHVASAGPEMVWKIYDAVRVEDRKEASVFIFEKKIADKLHKPRRRETVAEILRREVRHLQKIRHPKILQVLHPVEECHDSLAFATEPILASLANLLGNYERLPIPVPQEIRDVEFIDVEIKYGILQISEALSYLHGVEQMLHGNICPQSILVTKRGCWKLAGLGFAEKTKDGKDSFPCQPWTTKNPKMAQADLDYVAPEIQLDKNCTCLSDIFSLGMLICTVYNGGKSLIDANHSPSLYIKRVEQLTEYFGECAHKMPLALVEPVEKMINRDIRYRPTCQLFLMLKYFHDAVVTCLQHLDMLDHKDTAQKLEFYASLGQVIPCIPKKVLYQHVFPILRDECKSPDSILLALPSVLTVIDFATRDEYNDIILPHFRPIMCMPKPVQATVYLLDKLDIILAKTPREEIKTEVLPLVFNTLDSNSLQGQDAALNAIGIIKEYLDDSVMRKMVLPRAKALFYKSGIVKIRINALLCIDRLLDSLDKMIILDEVLPFLTEISYQDPDVLMAIVGLYKHMLSDKKFGLTHNLIASKVMPLLIPHTVNPGLSMEQFSALMEVLRDMLQHIDKQRRNKMRLETVTVSVPPRGSIKMRQNHIGSGEDKNLEEKLAGRNFLSVEDAMQNVQKCRTAPSTPELQQRQKLVSPKSQRRNHSLQSLGTSLDEKPTLERPVEILRRYSLIPPGLPGISIIPDDSGSEERPRRPSTQSLGPLVVPETGERRNSRGSIFGGLIPDSNQRRPSFSSLGDSVMQFLSGK